MVKRSCNKHIQPIANAPADFFVRQNITIKEEEL